MRGRAQPGGWGQRAHRESESLGKAQAKHPKSRGSQNKAPPDDAKHSFADTSLQFPFPPPPTHLLSYHFDCAERLFSLVFKYQGRHLCSQPTAMKARLWEKFSLQSEQGTLESVVCRAWKINTSVSDPQQVVFGILQLPNSALDYRFPMRGQCLLPRACKPCPAEVTLG